jgi:hypothetical protein
VMNCEWEQAGNSLYLHGKRVVGERCSGPIRGEGGVVVVGVKKACGHGGWGKCINLCTIGVINLKLLFLPF